ncbi:hypothetical protein [Thiocapsa rosea]|uniref:Uncharacterized protein n=1 Tax=Thiocapsa rosea TaxID=69360 RepID=A0A495V8H3_9GAMM|nr:hypothetical protein [Thiocapsa rosea]RKT45584.1 hypothetical protein BDD21_3048 [Thiocapsa rosea]
MTLAAFVLLVAGVLGSAWLVATRLAFLAPYRAGWVMYLANLTWELLEKRTHVRRAWLELAGAGTSLVLLGLGGVGAVGLAVAALLFLGLELVARARERGVLTGLPARLDLQGLRSPASPGVTRFPAPSVHPDLTLTLEAPFVERDPAYRLGLLPLGVPFEIELIIGNHTLVPTQWSVRAELVVPSGFGLGDAAVRTLPPLSAGAAARLTWVVTPVEVTGAGTAELKVSWDGEQRSIRIAHEGARAIDSAEIRSVVVRRYPGARRAAFAWRGDMDLYDTSSFQSIEGLEVALALGARYGIAQTLFMSTRLTLDETAAREWAAHYGVDRGADEIPRFIAWMREHVELRHASPYPVESERPYVMELGNHGHLHYDTDTAGAPGNGWKAGARPGEGDYPWLGEDKGSFGDQRDNILEAERWFRRCLDFVPRSWAKPGRGNDSYTPAAVEAAGCEVASGSDIRPSDNALRQPPPHHPAETRLVELTARYPGDPQHIHHFDMLRFWLHRAHRLGIPMVLMCHQHLRQFDGTACARLTEALLRHALGGFRGDLYLDTVYGIGVYWRDVLSPSSAVVRVTHEAGRVTLTNGSERDLVRVPVDIQLADGGRITRLVSVASGERVVVGVAVGL